MRKLLSQALGAVLAVAVTLPASATAPLAKKAVGTQQASTVELKATAAPKNAVAKPARKTRFSGQSAFAPLGRRQAQAAKKPRGVMAPEPSAQAGTLCGLVVYSENWTQDNAPMGAYKIPTTAGGNFELLAEGPAGLYGATLVEGVLYVGDYVDYGFFAFPLMSAYNVYDDFAEVDAPAASYDLLANLTTVYDPATAKAYGTFNNADASELTFSAVDFPSGVNTPIAARGEVGYTAMGIASDGQMYGITTSNLLVKIDKTTGEETTVGTVPVSGDYVGGGCIDPATDTFYYTISTDNGGAIYSVDLATANATLLCDFAGSEEVVGLFMLEPEAAANAPAKATGLSLAFEGAALSGNVKFTAPATLFDGTPASGEITYTVYVDGVAKATGTTTFGAEVEAPLTLDADGMYTIAVTTTNGGGESPKVKTTAYIGQDTPRKPEVEATYADGAFTVTWNTPIGTNGGAVPSLTYTVTRYPDEVVVATDTEANTLTDPVATPSTMTIYSYGVVAKSGGKRSAEGKSNTTVLGLEAAEPPYTEAFDAVDFLDIWTVIDANADGKQWVFDASKKAARMTYNSSKAMDDWMISPAIKLQGGKLYNISIDLACNGTSYPERAEVKYGTAASVSGMTGIVLEPTTVGTKDFTTYTVSISPEADGDYYFGIHGISDADMYYLYAANFKVSAPMSADMPAQIADLTVTPDATGALSAEITFTTPDKTFAGADLTAIDKVEIKRGDDVVKTFEAPAVGTQLTYTDTPEASGSYTYTVTATNAEGTSVAAEATVYVGINLPAPVTNVSVYEHADDFGYVTLTWDPVTLDKDGNPLADGTVTYNIYSQAKVKIYSGLTVTTKNIRLVYATDTQFLTCLYVESVTDGGAAEMTQSNVVFVGKPDENFAESVADTELHYDYALASNGAQWSIGNDATFSDISSQDADNGFFYSYGEYLDKSATLITGKIQLPASAPQVVFHTYPLSDQDANLLELAVEKLDGTITTVHSAANNTLPVIGGWNRVAVMLPAEYAGEIVKLRFTSVIKAMKYTLLDNIAVTQAIDHDLAVTDIKAPAAVAAGTEFKVAVSIVNQGSNAAQDYTVDLYANGEKAQTVNGTTLASGADTTVEFPLTLSVVSPETNTYKAVVTYAADLDTDNNTSDEVTVTLKHNSHPTVEGLAAEETAQGIKLTWNEPDTSAPAPGERTEDFESGSHGDLTFEGWTFVDGDESPVGGFQGLDIPGITPGSTKASFFVFDASTVTGNTAASFAAHSGDKFLGTLFRYDDGTIDDWAISPVLPGTAQTISFWAKSYSDQYPDKLAVYYSTGSLDIADFTEVVAPKVLTTTWTQITANLPAGAKYFAIRSMATGSFMLMIDDVTFTSTGAAVELSLEGYNVYRNGEKLHLDPVEEAEYHDTEVAEGTHTYHVTAVYDKGESRPVAVTADKSAIASVLAGQLAIKAASKSIVVTGAQGMNVAVYNVDGKTIFAGAGQAKTVIPAQTGVYVVKAGTTVSKVIVK